MQIVKARKANFKPKDLRKKSSGTRKISEIEIFKNINDQKTMQIQRFIK